jgi:hypothetical protein
VARSDLRAALIAGLLVVFAAGIGLAIGSRARSPAAPSASAGATTIALPSATAADPAEVQRRAFAQPLAAGCATERAVWLFADGGAAIRFDGRTWSIPDPTLRSLAAAACDAGTALAVGGAGSLLTVDEDRRAVRVDRFGIDDLRSVARLPDGAIAVGSGGAVLRQSALGWTGVGGSIADELFGVGTAGSVVWIVGAGGVSYRLGSGGWDPYPSGTTVTLRAVAIPSIDTAIAAGDAGTLLRWTAAGWVPIRTGTTVALRAAAVVGAATWVVGDEGTAIEILGERVRRIDLATSCPLRAVFPQGAAVWVVGSDGTRGAAWRVTPTGIDHWGSC